MMFMSVTIFFCAVVFSPVHAALQESIREQSMNKKIEMSQEPTCSDNTEASPNADRAFVKPGSCIKTSSESVGLTSASEALRDLTEELSAGHAQHASGIYDGAVSHYMRARDLAQGLEDKSHLAEAAQSLAAVWLLQGKLNDASDELLTTLALTRTASLLHMLGNVHREKGHMTKALDRYEEARGLESTPQLLVDMGEALARLGSFDTAYKHVEDTLKRSEHKSLDAARAFSLTGFIQLSRGDPSTSLQKLDAALSIQANVLRPGHPDLVLTQMRRAQALRDMGNLDTALEEVDTLVQVLAKLKFEKLQLFRVLTQKANFLHELGRLADAKEVIEKVFALQAKTYGQQDVPEVASVLNIYGSILHDKGDMSDAHTQYAQALQMNLDTVGQWHPETAAVHNSLGTLLQDEGNVAKAGHHFEACLEIQLKTLGENNPELASTYNNIATVAFREGRLDEAEVHLERALSLLDAVQVPKECPDRVTYATNLSDLRKLRG